MKVSSHLEAFHKAAAEHHGEMVDAHQAAMAKGQDSSMTAFHKAASSSHEKMQDFHATAVEECQKALTDSLGKEGDRIVPDQVRGVITSFPTMIPRAGAPAEPVRPNVPVEFQDLVKIDDD
jgi:hypothetical protein